MASRATHSENRKHKRRNKQYQQDQANIKIERKNINFNNGRGEDLPIFIHKQELIDSVRKHQTTIVMGETGSGKSTQLPKYLAEMFTTSDKNNKSKGNCIVCTQPRRVAAITVAQRVASELDVSCGQEVGYAVRFDDSSSINTRIKFVTDGVLLRECMTNADLSGYSVLILDEAHERSLNTDILMGIIRNLQDTNPMLRVVVMSATLQIGVFMEYFKDTNLICIEGRQFPVEVMYTKEPEADYLDAAMRTCLHIHANQPLGGVLVFLPGQEDIENLMLLLEENLPAVQAYHGTDCISDSDDQGMDESIVMRHQSNHAQILATKKAKAKKEKEKERGLGHTNQHDEDENDQKRQAAGPVEVVAAFHDFEVRPLYASMSPEQQLEAFAPCIDKGSRKFVLSTNIAETSVTINDIVYVVDTGYFKCKVNDTATGMDMLKTVPVSKQQADQRRGRAGRTGPGQCYRVYTEEVYDKQLAEEAIPEIQRVNISQVILQLKTIGVKSPQNFPYVSAPSRSSLRNAMEELLLLGALDSDTADLTPLGHKMSVLPLAPMYANVLLQSALCVDGGFIRNTADVDDNANTTGTSTGTMKIPAMLYGCVQEMLTTVSMLSIDGVYIQPHNVADKELAVKKHRNLSVKAGDLPTLLHIYNSWIQSRQNKAWATENFLSQRALLQAHNIRNQLHDILYKICFQSNISPSLSTSTAGNRNTDKGKGNRNDNGQESAVSTNISNKSPFPSCLPQLEPYLKCLAAGLCLNVAQRVAEGASQNDSGLQSKYYTPSTGMGIGKGGGGSRSAQIADREAAPYVTLRGRQPVHIHPSSVLFSAATGHVMELEKSKNKAAAGGGSDAKFTKKSRLPPYVIYSDLLITTKSYMKGVTGVQGEWLLDAGSTGNCNGMFRKVHTSGSTSGESSGGAGQKRTLSGGHGSNFGDRPDKKRANQQITPHNHSHSIVVPSTSSFTLTSAPQVLAATQGRSVVANVIASKYISISKQKKQQEKNNSKLKKAQMQIHTLTQTQTQTQPKK